MDNSHIEKMLESAKKLEEQVAKHNQLSNNSFVAKFLENQKAVPPQSAMVNPEVHRHRAIMEKLDALAVGLQVVMDSQLSIFDEITGRERPELEE